MSNASSSGATGAAAEAKAAPGTRWAAFGPPAIVAIGVAFVGAGSTLHPRAIPAPLLGKPVPRF